MMLNRSQIAVAGVAAGALLVGIVGGTALANVPALLAPANLSADSGVDATPMPVPEYPLNENGETFGSAAVAPAPGLEPDLIAAEATNGAEGYVRKTELEAADGTAAMRTFRSPEDALAWQRDQKGKSAVVPVYALDGETVVGEFLITAAEPSEK